MSRGALLVLLCENNDRIQEGLEGSRFGFELLAMANFAAQVIAAIFIHNFDMMSCHLVVLVVWNF